LLLHGTAPAIATHDPAILDHACAFAKEHNINCAQFEFQMLLGVRRDLQEDLRQRGYRVRIYVPYGAQWYPYFTRRLAERPANVLFVLRNLVAE
jgi:proline dehydrogenase